MTVPTVRAVPIAVAPLAVPSRPNRDRCSWLVPMPGMTREPVAAPAVAEPAKVIAETVAAAMESGLRDVAPYSSQGARFEAEFEIEHVGREGGVTRARMKIGYGR